MDNRERHGLQGSVEKDDVEEFGGGRGDGNGLKSNNFVEVVQRPKHYLKELAMAIATPTV